MLSSPVFLYTFSLLSCVHAASQAISPSAIASQYALTTSTSLPAPTATLSSSDTQMFLKSSWSLSNGRIIDGGANLAFVSDPFPNNSSSSANSSVPVLQVTYPAGSYSHDTGGAQLYALWNASHGSAFNSMLLAYEVAFDADWDWVKGGKLPGLRGGPDIDGCDGGLAANGSSCFSSRVMWRTDGEGEGIFLWLLFLTHGIDEEA